MRDYPTVPNVFRVASSHSVDTDCATTAAGCDIKITSRKNNANLPKGQLREQQQKQKQQKPNGNISGQQQSLVKSGISSQTTKTSATISQTVTKTTTPAITTATAPNPPIALQTATVPSTTSTTITITKTSAAQQHEKTENDVDFIMQKRNSLQKQQHYKLTTHASIEQPQCRVTSQTHLQQSPYATLPRNTVSLTMLNDSTITTGVDIRKQHHNSVGNSNNSNNPSQSNNNGNSNRNNSHTSTNNSNDPTMLGVVNTISGSIPSTGYTIDSLAATKSNSNSADAGSIFHRTISMASDLNVGINNSYTNLSKLNGVPQQQQQQEKHLRLQQEQQPAAFQNHDFKPAITMDDFSTYRRSYPCRSHERNTNGYLWIITPVAASISVAIVIAALAGPQWLFTEEKLPNTLYNGTANFNVLDDGAFITRYTKSSLWIICTTIQGVETYSCIKIDYFSEKGYQPDPHDSASAIPYTVTKSCPFFLASGIVLLLSFIVFLIPTCSHQNNLYYFSAGIMFIVSGLLMLIGLIAYISILKAEIGSKLRPRSTLQPPLFKVTYGQSFFLFVFGFIATEFVGLLNIFLYISLQEVGYYSRLPCFTISNLQEKIKEGENRFNSHTYKSYKHEIDRQKPLEKTRKQQNRKHQVTAQELDLNTKKLLKNMTQGNGRNGVGIAPRTARRVVDAVTDANAGPYACRKHPNGLSSTMFLNEMNRRYYFEKPITSSTRSKCNLHSRNLAKSLNELYAETSSSSALLLPPLPPSSMRGSGLQLQTQTLPRPPQQFSDSPQEFPLTRSVSTTTDIYATQNLSFGTNNNQRRNVATNTRYNSDTETQTNGEIKGTSGGSRGIDTKSVLQQCNNIINSKKNLPQQLQQLNPRQHSNIYQTNFAEITCPNNDDLAGDTIDIHNHRLHHGTVNDRTIDGSNDDHEHDDEDDEEADEEQPQKLCGLKRSIRKTKDELFEEFCKRAGVRPKPKTIYYIDSHEGDKDDDVTAANGNLIQKSAEIKEEMQRKPLKLNNACSGSLQQRRNEIPESLLKQQKQQQHHQQQQQRAAEYRIFGDALDAVDMDEELNENGFKKLNEDEEHLFVIDDNIHLMPQSIRPGRRASMYVEPNHLRRLSSNLSLHGIYAPTSMRTGLQKSLYDLDTNASEFGLLTTQHQQQQQPQQSHYTLRNNTYGGSQQRLHHDYHNQAMYQSRTLPRAFLKRNADSPDSITTTGVNVNSAQLHNLYSSSQQRLTTLMMQHQQQLQQQNRYLSMSREQELYNSRYGLHKSNEELNRQYIQHQPIYIQPHQLQQYQQQQYHANVPCSNYSTASNFTQPPLVQWPAAIPSSPSNFSGSFRLYGTTTNITNATQQNAANSHTLLARSNSNTSAITAGGQQVVVNTSATAAQAPPKFQRGYAFDEQHRPSAVLADAFDLDEMERERRRSHASLFTVNSNGVALGSGMSASVGIGVGVIANTNKNQDHYDMINGTAV